MTDTLESLLKHLSLMCQNTKASLSDHQYAQHALAEIAKYIQENESAKAAATHAKPKEKIKELEKPKS